jgi:hypothetical protein
MTKAAAIYQFWAGFGLTAYEENSVPTGDGAPEFPYITYELITSSDLDRMQASASLWYRGTSWLAANAKAEEISAVIAGGSVIPCDGGAIIVRKATPFAQNMGDDTDNMIKRKVLSIEYLYATQN